MSTFIDGVEMQWLTENGPPFDRILQYRMRYTMFSSLSGVEYMHSPWENVPTVVEKVDD